MCNMSNEVPQLFDWDQERNQPADRWSRLELNYGCVEFVAGVEYMVSWPRISNRDAPLTNYWLVLSRSLGLHNLLCTCFY